MACREEFPHLETLHRELGATGLRVIAIDVSNDVEGVRQFFERNGFTIPVGFDAGQVVSARNYGVVATPTNYVLDGDGTIVWRHYGFRPGDEVELRRELTRMLDSE